MECANRIANRIKLAPRDPVCHAWISPLQNAQWFTKKCFRSASFVTTDFFAPSLAWTNWMSFFLSAIWGLIILLYLAFLSLCFAVFDIQKLYFYFPMNSRHQSEIISSTDFSTFVSEFNLYFIKLFFLCFIRSTRLHEVKTKVKVSL